MASDESKVKKRGIEPSRFFGGSTSDEDAVVSALKPKEKLIESRVVASVNKSFSRLLQNITTDREEEQQKTYNFLSTQLEEINRNILAIGTSLSSLSSGLTRETAREEQRIVQERNRRTRLAERESFGQAETVLENRISNAIVAPTQKATKAIQGPLTGLKAALGLLFGGWLTDKIIKAFKAKSEGNKEQFDELKIEIAKGVGAAILAFSTLDGGLIRLTASLARIGLSLSGFLLKKPFEWLGNLFKRGPKPPTTRPPSGRPPTTRPPSGRPPTSGGRPPTTRPPSGRPPISGENPPAGNPPGPGPRPPAAPGGSVKPPTPPRGSKNILDKLSGITKNVKGFLGDLTKGAVRRLVPILNIGLFAASAKNRLDSGKSPAQAVLPIIPQTLLSYGTSGLGAAAGAIIGSGVASGPLSIAGAVGGGILGNELGQYVTDLIDSQWQPSWDETFFNDFNKGIVGFLEKQINYKPKAPTTTPQGTQGRSKAQKLEVIPYQKEEETKNILRGDASSVKPTGTKSEQGRFLSQVGAVEGTPTVIDLSNLGGTKRNQNPVPNTSPTKIPEISTSDPLNPFIPLAKSVYNLRV